MLHVYDYKEMVLSRDSSEAGGFWRFMSSRNKFDIGFWGSEYIKDSKYKSRWEEFYEENDLFLGRDMSEYICFKVKEEANILVINSLEDLHNLDDKYIVRSAINDKYNAEKAREKAQKSELSFRNYLSWDIKCVSNFIGVNFLRIKNIYEDFDGVYVTPSGYGDCAPIFNEWSIPSIVIFNLKMIECCDEPK